MISVEILGGKSVEGVLEKSRDTASCPRDVEGSVLDARTPKMIPALVIPSLLSIFSTLYGEGALNAPNRTATELRALISTCAVRRG